MRVIKKNEARERGRDQTEIRVPREGACARLFASAWDRRYVRSFRAGAAVRLIYIVFKIRLSHASSLFLLGPETRTTSSDNYVFGQNMTEYNPAPSPSGHPFLSGPTRRIYEIFRSFTCSYCVVPRPVF